MFSCHTWYLTCVKSNVLNRKNYTVVNALPLQEIAEINATSKSPYEENVLGICNTKVQVDENI